MSQSATFRLRPHLLPIPRNWSLRQRQIYRRILWLSCLLFQTWSCVGLKPGGPKTGWRPGSGLKKNPAEQRLPGVGAQARPGSSTGAVTKSKKPGSFSGIDVAHLCEAKVPSRSSLCVPCAAASHAGPKGAALPCSSPYGPAAMRPESPRRQVAAATGEAVIFQAGKRAFQTSFSSSTCGSREASGEATPVAAEAFGSFSVTYEHRDAYDYSAVARSRLAIHRKRPGTVPPVNLMSDLCKRVIKTNVVATIAYATALNCRGFDHSGACATVMHFVLPRIAPGRAGQHRPTTEIPWTTTGQPGHQGSASC